METITDIGDKLPEAGEPLKPKSHPQNDRAEREELEQRVSRLSGKLSRRHYHRLKREFNGLWKKLYKAKYAKLIDERDALIKQHLAIAEAYKKATKDCDKIAKTGREIAARGRELNKMLMPLEPMYLRWAEIKNMLDAHDMAVAYEREQKENERKFYEEAQRWAEQMKSTMRRLPELRYCHTTPSGKNITDIPEFELIDFRVDSVYYKIKTSYQSFWMRWWRNKWRDALPEGVHVEDLLSERILKDLSASTDRIVRGATSEVGHGIYWIIDRPDSPEGIPKHVHYSNLIQYYPRDLHKKTPFIAGITTNRKLLYYTLEENPHLLIAGTTNSGKSTFVNSLIATCISMNSPTELRLVLIDLKGGIELQHFEGAKHNLMPLVRERENVLPTLVAVRKIMQRRLKILASANMKKASILNQNAADDSIMARILLLVDEMALLAGMGDTTRQIQDELRIISSQGRAANVHMVLCTQNTNVAIIEGPTKTNMVMRISGKMPDQGSSMSILGSAAATKLPDGVPGRFVFSRGLTEAIAQTPDISDAEIAKSVMVANQYPDPTNAKEFKSLSIPQQPEDIEAVEFDDETPLPTPRQKFGEDDFIALALSRFDGKLSVHPIHEALGNDVITRRNLEKLCKDLIQKDEITHAGVSYSIKKIGRGYVLRPVTPKTESVTQDAEHRDTFSESVNDETSQSEAA